MSAAKEQSSRYVSFLCQACGFWFDGQVGGQALYCAQCATPLRGNAEDVQREAIPSPGQGVRALVCEDGDMLRKAIVRMLTSLGCEVRAAENGKQGIEALDWDPQIILTDVDMPLASGLDVVRTLREDLQRRDVQVVVLTGRSDATTVSQMMQWDVMAYLLKDQVGSKELRQKLQQCLVAVKMINQGEVKRQVIVAEDSYTYRHAVVAILEKMSCEVSEAEDGMEALEMARKKMPDLIISDLQMPRLSGLDLLRQIRSLPGGGRLPFVMLTGHGEDQAMSAAMAEGVSAYILKDQAEPAVLKKQIQMALTTSAALA
jgi:CheY-like chemotaxis protein